MSTMNRDSTLAVKSLSRDHSVTKRCVSSEETCSDLHVYGGGGRESNPPDEDRSSQPL